MSSKPKIAPIPKSLIYKPALRLSKLFGFVYKFYPNLGRDLVQSDQEMDPRVYATIAFLEGLFTTSIMLLLFYSLVHFVLAKHAPLSDIYSKWALTFVGLSILSGFVIFVKILSWPKLVSMKRYKLIKRDLLPALNHLYVQITSGVTVYQAVANVAKADYGLVSKEFKRIVFEVAAGKSLEKALEESATHNPEPHYRRAIWQLLHALQSGVEVGTMLKEIVFSLTEEQKLELKKYSRDLNPITLMYMVSSVIFPALGITAMIVISSIAGSLMNKSILLFIPILLAFVQIFFITFISAKRPEVIESGE